MKLNFINIRYSILYHLSDDQLYSNMLETVLSTAQHKNYVSRGFCMFFNKSVYKQSQVIHFYITLAMISYTPTYWKGSVLLFNITIKGLYIPRAFCSFSKKSELKQRAMISYTSTYWKGSYLLLNLRTVGRTRTCIQEVTRDSTTSRDKKTFSYVYCEAY